MSSMFFFNKLHFTDSSQSVCSLAARFHILSECSGGWSNADITNITDLHFCRALRNITAKLRGLAKLRNLHMEGCQLKHFS